MELLTRANSCMVRRTASLAVEDHSTYCALLGKSSLRFGVCRSRWSLIPHDSAGFGQYRSNTGAVYRGEFRSSTGAARSCACT
eukprot:2274187-Amphidinium_carterae.2